MADEDISLTEDQLLENLDDGNNGDSEFLNEVNHFSVKNEIILQKNAKSGLKFMNWCQVL